MVAWLQFTRHILVISWLRNPTCHNVTWHDMTWHDMTWHDTMTHHAGDVGGGHLWAWPHRHHTVHGAAARAGAVRAGLRHDWKWSTCLNISSVVVKFLRVCLTPVSSKGGQIRNANWKSKIKLETFCKRRIIFKNIYPVECLFLQPRISMSDSWLMSG